MSAGRQRSTWGPGEFWAPGELGAPGAQRVGGYLGDTRQRGGNIVVIFLWSQTGRFQSNELGISKYDAFLKCDDPSLDPNPPPPLPVKLAPS